MQIGGVSTTFCHEEGMLLQKHRDRNGTCNAVLCRSIGVWGRFDSTDATGHRCPTYRLQGNPLQGNAGKLREIQGFLVKNLVMPPKRPIQGILGNSFWLGG